MQKLSSGPTTILGTRWIRNVMSAVERQDASNCIHTSANPPSTNATSSNTLPRIVERCSTMSGVGLRSWGGLHLSPGSPLPSHQVWAGTCGVCDWADPPSVGNSPPQTSNLKGIMAHRSRTPCIWLPKRNARIGPHRPRGGEMTSCGTNMSIVGCEGLEEGARMLPEGFPAMLGASNIVLGHCSKCAQNC